jgi:hypothetical protein
VTETLRSVVNIILSSNKHTLTNSLMLCVQGYIENDNVWPRWSSYYEEQDLGKNVKEEKTQSGIFWIRPAKSNLFRSDNKQNTYEWCWLRLTSLKINDKILKIPIPPTTHYQHKYIYIHIIKNTWLKISLWIYHICLILCQT